MIQPEKSTQKAENAISAPHTLISAVGRGLRRSSDHMWTNLKRLWPAFLLLTLFPVVGYLAYAGSAIALVMDKKGLRPEGMSFTRLSAQRALRHLWAMCPWLLVGVAVACTGMATQGTAWGKWATTAVAVVVMMAVQPIHRVMMELFFGSQRVAQCYARLSGGYRHYVSLVSFTFLSALITLPLLLVGSIPFALSVYVWLQYSASVAMGDAPTLPALFYVFAAAGYLVMRGVIACTQLSFTWINYYVRQYFLDRQASESHDNEEHPVIASL